jgi:hypothetical protein
VNINSDVEKIVKSKLISIVIAKIEFEESNSMIEMPSLPNKTPVLVYVPSVKLRIISKRNCLLPE